MTGNNHVLAFECQPLECAERPGNSKRLKRIPCAENDERDGNPACTCRHVFLPPRHEHKRKICSGKSAQYAAAQDIYIFVPCDIYSRRIGGGRIFTDCPHIQTPARMLIKNIQKHGSRNRKVHIRTLIKKRRADHRNSVKKRNRTVIECLSETYRQRARCKQLAEKSCYACSERCKHQSCYHLIAAQRYGNNRINKCSGHSRSTGRNDSDSGTSRHHAAQIADRCTHEHHAFYAEIRIACFFEHDAAERSQQNMRSHLNS